MRINSVKELWKAGKPAFGTWSTIVHHPRYIKLLAMTGMDFVVIEMEHSDYSIGEVGNMCLLAREAGIVPIVRVAGEDLHSYTRPLDAGAMGLVLPDVKSAADLDAILHYTKYHPRGKRILNLRGPHTDYIKTGSAERLVEINDQNLTIAMIESKAGLDNIEELCGVEGLDGIMVGPDDLSHDLGVPTDFQHPLMTEALEHIIDVCNRHDMVWGWSCQDYAAAQKWLGRGMRWMPYRNDVAVLYDTFSEASVELKRMAGRN